MSYRAWSYIYGVLLIAGVLTATSLVDYTNIHVEFAAFVTLVLLCTWARLYKTLFQSKLNSGHGTLSYSPSLVFLFAGILLLRPFFFVLLVIIPHLIEWVKERWQKTSNLPAWYIQPFNIATHIIAGLITRSTYIYLTAPINNSLPSPVFAMTIAAIVYVILNHLLIGQALVLARNLTWSETGILTLDSMLPDLIMGCLGYALATLWMIDPWMILAVLAPLGLVQRALMVPQLQKEVKVDTKTGLLNARYFAKQLVTEVEQAQRLHQPLALLLADLDLLRNINNTYGHLAGDAVLIGISEIIRKTVGDHDLAARFGGEEFTILMPNAEAVDAYALAERLRQTIEATDFTAATSVTPIRATISIGVACLPTDATTITDLIHQADMAVYQAKYQGRNRVVCAAHVAQAIRLDYVPQKVREIIQGIPDAPSDARPGGDPKPTPPIIAHTPQARLVHPPQPLSSAQVPQANTRLLSLFVSTTIAAAISITISGFVLGEINHGAVITILALLAALVEVFQINVYGQSTTSVSVAVAFAAALLGGLPGTAIVSAVIAGTHYIRRRPQLYKAAFNWATHMLAGAVPALLTPLILQPLQIGELPALALPIVGAALAYYLIDTGLIAMAISLTLSQPVGVIWREQFRWLAWHYLSLCTVGLFLATTYITIGLVSIIIFILPITMLYLAQKQYIDQTEQSMRELRRLNAELSQANSAVVQVNDELFTMLAKMFDSRDPYVGCHAAQVSLYSVAIATELGITGQQLDTIRQAGYLHDIGKIAIPESLLYKPTTLTDAEYELVKTHATLGAELVETSQGLRHLAPLIRYHHEHWDGRGYPEGLAGESIPLGARILSVADAVEAMAADRPYHRGMSLQEIIAEVSRCSGTQFDPKVAEVFVRIAEREGEALIINSARTVAHRYDTQSQLGAQHDIYVAPGGLSV